MLARPRGNVSADAVEQNGCIERHRHGNSGNGCVARNEIVRFDFIQLLDDGAILRWSFTRPHLNRRISRHFSGDDARQCIAGKTKALCIALPGLSPVECSIDAPQPMRTLLSVRSFAPKFTDPFQPRELVMAASFASKARHYAAFSATVFILILRLLRVPITESTGSRMICTENLFALHAVGHGVTIDNAALLCRCENLD